MIKSIRSASVKGKRVLVRVDFNVFPLNVNEPRFKKTIPTIKELQRRGAKVILLTHLETNDGKIPSATLLHKFLKRYFFSKLPFAGDIAGKKAVLAVSKLRSGESLLLDNLRRDPGEKKCSMEFARRLARLGDIYVNEAFSVSHRRHASIVFLPKLLPAYAGSLLESEISNLSKVFRPPHPFTLILGGGKVDTKLPLLRRLLPKVDHALLGGVIANKFFESPIISSKKIILPSNLIKHGSRILDDTPAAVKKWQPIIRSSRLVVWNGPLGFIEEGYTAGTRALV